MILLRRVGATPAGNWEAKQSSSTIAASRYFYLMT
jgi:hypothetical protein